MEQVGVACSMMRGNNPPCLVEKELDYSYPAVDRLSVSEQHMGVSKNRGTPKSSILIGFSIINHPFWGAPIFGNTHMVQEWQG